MASRITGKKAVLVNRGSALNAEIKALTDELKEVKKELGVFELSKGTYTTTKGGVLKITETQGYTDINPIEAHKHMKTQRMGKHFPEVVKVILKDFKRYCDDSELEELRTKKKVSQRWSWS